MMKCIKHLQFVTHLADSLDIYYYYYYYSALQCPAHESEDPLSFSQIWIGSQT